MRGEQFCHCTARATRDGILIQRDQQIVCTRHLEYELIVQRLNKAHIDDR